MKYKICATSANLGIGFDCMGLALDLYNIYDAELAAKDEAYGFSADEKDNLFLYAYHKAAEYCQGNDDGVCVHMECHIPKSRGLGSSASLTVGGIYAYSVLHGNCLSKEDILEISTMIEGHPDNAAPAIYGGLCVIHRDKMLKVRPDSRWKIGLWIPDYEVATSEARKVLKSSYERNEAVNNISAAVLAVDAIRDFNLTNIGCIMDDVVHEPYRRVLIKDYDRMKEYALGIGARAFIISGSGSTCLSLSDKHLDAVFDGVEYMETDINERGIIDVW